MIVGTTLTAADIFAPLFAVSQGETVATVHLDEERHFLALTVEGTGEEDRIQLPTRRILGKALRLGAAAIIVAHNHPSGDPDPSEADLRSTRALADAARLVDIRLHDHLIFGGGEWRSFYALGLI